MAEEKGAGPSEDEWGQGDEVIKVGGGPGKQQPLLCEGYKARGYCLNVKCKRSHTKPITGEHIQPPTKQDTLLLTSEKDFPTPKVQYSADQLRTIGQICSGSLPPASTVQAMFMYELQRQAENEKLFDSLILRLARGEDTTNTAVDRLASVEAELKTLKIQIGAGGVQQKLATILTRYQQQAAKLEYCKKQLDTHDARFEELAAAIETVREKTFNPDSEADHEYLNATMIRVHQHEKDLDTIFAERDALLQQLQASNVRISKLEDLVRTMTANMSPTINTSPTMTQQLPVQSSGGQTLNLAIPKGTSLSNVNAKENRAPSVIKSFTPGQQWST